MATVRIGVDVGGTFTDLVLFNEETGETTVAKVPSTPRDQAVGILNAVKRALTIADATYQDVSYFAHGSTAATNALLEHRGARVGLITTRGFRDLLEIGRQSRPELYDLQADRPQPLVSRDLRLEVDERVTADGEVLVPLDLEEVGERIEELIALGAEAIAVCFLHSYLRPEHEEAVAQMVRDHAGDVFAVSSHDSVAEYREVERLSTTVVNAYLGPEVARYVHSLENALKDAGVASQPLMTQSNGGLISLSTAARYPSRIALSGPSAGLVGAKQSAAQSGVRDFITFDMGGTSTDVALARDGQFAIASERNIGGYPIKAQALDLHTVGSGGGSIAWIDGGGLLKVGPQSAGSEPGPASYGRGGTVPTLTDANVVLGAIGPTSALGGDLVVDRDLAVAAIAPLAEQLGQTVEQTARGIITVTVSNLVRAIRAISVKRGLDHRDFALVAFGGAGPLAAPWLIREMGIREMLVPAHPGLLCAFGLLVADMQFDVSRTRVTPLAEARDMAVETFTELLAECAEIFNRENVPDAARSHVLSVDMRYVGQSWELPVELDSVDEFDAESLARKFDEAHAEQFGYSVPGEPIDCVTFRIRVVGETPKMPDQDHSTDGGRTTPPMITVRELQLGDTRVEAPVYDRAQLVPGDELVGPAIIEQLDATTLLLPGQNGRVDHALNIRVVDTTIPERKA